MKRRIAVVVVVLGLAVGLFQLRTSAQQSSDELQRGRQEIAVMKSILQTTLEFAAQNLESGQTQRSTGRAFGWRASSDITGLYLRGQGAVFTIPVAGMGRYGDPDFDFNFVVPEVVDVETGDAGEITVSVPSAVMSGLSDEEMARVQAELEKAQKDLEEEQTKAAEAKVKAKEKLQREMERLKKAQERQKQRLADREKRRAEIAQRIERFKVYLRDALANHGDSLSIVRPQEYVTFVITTDGVKGWIGGNGGDEQTQHVLSVKKSDVADFKGGRITREQFNHMMVEYQF